LAPVTAPEQAVKADTRIGDIQLLSVTHVNSSRVAFKKLAMAEGLKNINRLKFLARISSEIGKRGVIDVLRKGVDHRPVHFDLFYGTPSRDAPA
jgi:hypothetical protein